jgi:hypothetical protein
MASSKKFTRQKMIWWGIPFCIVVTTAILERMFLSTWTVSWIVVNSRPIFEFTGIFRAFRDTGNINVLYLWALALSWPLMLALSVGLMSLLPFRPASRDPKYSRSRVIRSILYFMLISIIVCFSVSGLPSRFNHKFLYYTGDAFDVAWQAFWFSGFTIHFVALLLQFDVFDNLFKGEII